MFGRAFPTKNILNRRLINTAVLTTARPTTMALAVSGVVAACAAFYYAKSSEEAEAGFGYVEDSIEPGHYPWGHEKVWQSFDHAAIRRGFKVYNEIGKACHSMKYIYYRQLINVAYTEEEMKAIAADHEGYHDPPNDEGEVLERTGALTDHLWNPYANEKEARAANNGALPPDLSVIVRARHHNENYLMALLTGYRDPPHGVVLSENMNYNIYFPGCMIAMPAPLAEGAVEYDDGTEASISQQAKDVTSYLTWSSSMDHDERHLMGLKSMLLLAATAVPFFLWKKFRWSTIKKRKVAFLRRRKDE
jgi:ubiquinol-cytochrome c reductase cytochrome c1 subunit